jgi:hypothetical protein
MATDREIELSYVPTTLMFADCFTKPLPKHTFLKQCSAMGMIGIGLRNGLGIVIENGHANGDGNGIGIGFGNGIGNAVRKRID